MSAQQCFAFCPECRELNYGITDRNGVFTRDSASSNHHHCENVYTFGTPDAYVTPIRLVLLKLHAGAEITHNEIVLFKLAIDLGELESTPTRVLPVAPEQFQMFEDAA